MVLSMSGAEESQANWNNLFLCVCACRMSALSGERKQTPFCQAETRQNIHVRANGHAQCSLPFSKVEINPE